MHWMHSVKQSWMFNRQRIGFLLMVVLMIFLLPLRWLGASVIAALLHELGHYTAVRLCGGSVQGLKLGVSGAIMETSGLNHTAELICLLAGPVAGLLPMLVFRCFPVISVCGLVQSIYNLLPIYPLDGGKIVRQMILMAGGDDRSFQMVENSILILLFLLSLYIRLRFGISLFLLLGIFLFRKTPCKPKKDWI